MFGTFDPAETIPNSSKPNGLWARQRRHHWDHVCLWNPPIFPTILKTIDYVGIVGRFAGPGGQFRCPAADRHHPDRRQKLQPGSQILILADLQALPAQ